MGEEINEQSKTINKQMSIFCVTFKEPTKPISYLEAELTFECVDFVGQEVNSRSNLPIRSAV